MAGGCFQPDGAWCWVYPRAVLRVTGGRRVGWGGGFILFDFVSFLCIFHILLSSRHTQLLRASAGWGSTGPSLAWCVHEDDCHGLLPPYLAPATLWVVAPSCGGSMSLTSACPSRLVLPLSLQGGCEARLDLASVISSPSSSPDLNPLKNAIVPVPMGTPVPYLHVPLAWMSLGTLVPSWSVWL